MLLKRFNVTARWDKTGGKQIMKSMVRAPESMSGTADSDEVVWIWSIMRWFTIAIYWCLDWINTFILHLCLYLDRINAIMQYSALVFVPCAYLA